ncbi:Crp/Fnr family transcriptional regulator [Miltoncostaea marina]|uniref:Crp/Fnr family transcriptional regulator n=1 Tax=Miltoncostaea marina TaxID=2843215 RepID=UPI001C3D1B68|nr:Crp/Fnr family transcriptional regulator [Miltoncostaea marina]
MGRRQHSPLTAERADPHVCTPDVRVRALARAPMFAALAPDALADVDARSRTVAFQEGERIYHALDPAERLHVVVTGAVKLTRLGPGGRAVLTDVLVSGEFAGALPALGQERYGEDAWALTGTCLLVFGAREVDDILRRHPSVALAALAAVSGRLAAAQEAIRRLSTASVEQRLAAVLLMLARKVGRPDGEGVLLHAPLGREDLAAMAAATPETISRELSGLRARGLVDAGRRWVRLRDVAALEAVAAG